jgi:4-hydroxybenzoate polyprenyltransferase
MKKLLAYMQLVRLPNVFTAMADIFMGFLIAHGSLAPWLEFLPLLAASSAIYLAGMVLNDWFDIEVDRVERPERPLPSGRIARGHALVVGIALLACGLGLAWTIGNTSRNVALLLVAAVLLYDGLLKSTVFGPPVMGLCRALNVLLGMSGVAGAIWLADMSRPPAWRVGTMAAAGIGLYIMAVTRFARREATPGVRLDVTSTTVGINLGLLLIALVAHHASRISNLLPESDAPYWMLVATDPSAPSADVRFYSAVAIWLAVVAATNAMVWRAIAHTEPRTMQQAVKTCIIALIGIDAALVALVNGSLWAAAVLVLLVPSLTLGRWVYST